MKFTKGIANPHRMKIILLCLIMVFISAMAWAVKASLTARQTKIIQPVATVFTVPVYDRALLAKFKALSEKYDTLRQSYTVSGTLSVLDKADTGTAVRNVPFIVCKTGNALYYKLGTNETLNENGLYLYIDHASKKMLLSKQRTMSGADAINNLSVIASTLKSEYYNMKGSLKGDLQTISFVNERHITCKEYTVTYDTLNYEIKHIYVRMTNMQEPLNKHSDKVIEMNLSEWDSKGMINNYTQPSDVLKKVGDKWKKNRSYESYELIYL